MLKKIFDKNHRTRTISYLLVIGAYLILEVFMKTGNLSSMVKNMLVPLCCFITTAIALNLVVGISGELSLGHAGFMSVGAFTAIVVSGYLAKTVTVAPLRLAIAMAAGALTATLVGYLISIPVLKLEGDYLAIVTLAFCQIIKSLINNIYLGFDENGFQFSFIDDKVKLAKGGKALISGPLGATGTARIASFTAGVILILIALMISYNLIYSKKGRAIMACRDNRIAARSVGINVTQMKTLTFTLSCALAGAAGALYALNYATLTPAKFDYNQSILDLVYVVLGGLGNINGTIVATTLLMMLPEMMRFLDRYRMLIYAVVLILIMLASNNPLLKQKLQQFKTKLSEKKGARNNAGE